MRHFYACRVTKSVVDYIGAIRKATVWYQYWYATVALHIAPT